MIDGGVIDWAANTGGPIVVFSYFMHRMTLEIGEIKGMLTRMLREKDFKAATRKR